MSAVGKAIESAIKHRSHGVLITETFDMALRQEKEVIQKGLNPFPVIIKDCFTIKDVKTTCASKMLENYYPSYTATAVQNLFDKGACLIGKSNMDEFSMGTSTALGYFGPVKAGLSEDVEDDWYIPGGSSGGSAVAVKLGMATCALGSDTGGSTRNPAAFNGIFGLKPTYGSVSRYGLIPLVNGLDTPAILAKSAADCATYFSIVSSQDIFDSTSTRSTQAKEKRINEIKVGIPAEYHNECLSDIAWKVWNRAANIFKSMGATVIPVSLPTTKLSLDCYQVLSAADIASNMARYDGVAYGYRSDQESSTLDLYASTRNESFNSVVRRRIMAGNYFLMKKHRAKYVDHAARIRRIIVEDYKRALNKVDVLLTPTAAGPAPLFSDLSSGNFKREDEDDFYTQCANICGIPSLSIPLGETIEKLPVGVQLMGSAHHDIFLCTIAEELYNNRMASPSTNPSSCDSSIDCAAPSSYNTEPIKPSSNQQYTNTLECSSPALAQAVPGADPNLPEASGPKIWFTTAMANQAAEDLAQGKARNVFEWYEQYKQRIAEEDRLRNQQNQPVNNENQNSLNDEGMASENKAKKPRLENAPGPSNIKNESDNEERVYETLVGQKENPLRRMEIMANSTAFKTSTKIAEVATENQTKRERIGKTNSNSENVTNASLPAPFGHPYNHMGPGSSPSFPGPSPYPFSYPLGFPGMPPMPYQSIPYPMAPGRVPNGYYGNYPGWPMHSHRVFAERAAQSGQVFPPSFGNIPFPPNYYFGYPHPIPPGPLSGPPQALHFTKSTSGPMTAPTAASGSLMPFDGKAPNAMDHQAQSLLKSHPTPLFSFSMEPSSQPSPLFQDLSNKHPN